MHYVVDEVVYKVDDEGDSRRNALNIHRSRRMSSWPMWWKIKERSDLEHTSVVSHNIDTSEKACHSFVLFSITYALRNWSILIGLHSRLDRVCQSQSLTSNNIPRGNLHSINPNKSRDLPNCSRTKRGDTRRNSGPIPNCKLVPCSVIVGGCFLSSWSLTHLPWVDCRRGLSLLVQV